MVVRGGGGSLDTRTGSCRGAVEVQLRWRADLESGLGKGGRLGPFGGFCGEVHDMMQ
jgi:hypothetical protein